jgi:hypothetical protein
MADKPIIRVARPIEIVVLAEFVGSSGFLGHLAPPFLRSQSNKCIQKLKIYGHKGDYHVLFFDDHVLL